MRVQVLGLCRFSYLGGGGFQTDHATIEDRRAYLYDPARLARRWFWFEHVALPGLLAQTDPDFTLVVMTGPDLPAPWLDRLRPLAATAPQLRLALVDPAEAHLDACLQAIAPHVEAGADVIAHFRHDDDDAVAVDYVAKARADFALAQPVFRRSRRVSIDYPRGFVLTADAGGIAVQPRMIANASAALTIYLKPDVRRTAVHFPHWKLALSMPGLVLPAQPRFVRLIHGDNDSGAVGAGYEWPVAAVGVDVILADRFRIDLPALRAGAATLPG